VEWLQRTSHLVSPCTLRSNVWCFDRPGIVVFHHDISKLVVWGILNRLQPLSFPPTQLHHVVFQSLLGLVARGLCNAGRLVVGRHPRCNDTGFGGIAKDVSVDGEDELIVGVFEGGGFEDGGEFASEFFLVEVAWGC